MPESTQTRQTPYPLWIWVILLFGLIMLFLLYSRATSVKALEIQQDIQSRTSQSLLKSAQTSAVSVTADGRDVTLNGMVANQDSRSTAEKIAMRTIGVRQVNNLITLGSQKTITELPEKKLIPPAKLELMPDEFPALPEVVPY